MDIDKELKNLLGGLVISTNQENQLPDKTIKQLFDEKLQALNLSQLSVEKSLEIEHKTLEGILSKTAKRIDVINLLKLSYFLDMPLESIVKLCVTEMPASVIGNIAKTKSTSFIVSNFDLPHLRKDRFLKGRLSNEQIEDRLKKFFGFNNIEEYSELVPVPAYMRNKKTQNEQMRDFWVTSAYRHFEAIKNPNDYDRDLLVELMPKIRPYTMSMEKGLITIIRALYNIGVTVIFQSKLTGVSAYGATFSVYNKPCIVVTDLNKNYPTIWFALMHELHHVLYDIESIASRVFHITGEPDLFLIQEDKANEFAREYLFSKERSKYIEPLIYNKYVVERITREAQVHESFAYNFYNYDKYTTGDKNAWRKFNNLIPGTDLATKGINSNVWNKETIEESVSFFKEKVFNLK